MNNNDEQIIYRERPSWLNYYFLYILGAILIAIQMYSGKKSGALFTFLVISGLAALFRFRYLFTITEDRIIARVGLIARNITEMRIQHIRTMLVKQSFIDRLLGIGMVESISAAEGTAAVKFKGIRNPVEVKEKIRNVLTKTKTSEFSNMFDRTD